MYSPQAFSEFLDRVFNLSAADLPAEWSGILESAGKSVGADRTYLIFPDQKPSNQWCAPGADARIWNGTVPEMELASAGIYKDDQRCLCPMHAKEGLLGIAGFDWLDADRVDPEAAKIVGQAIERVLVNFEKPDPIQEQHWRLASLGLFAGALAHEINTPLFFIEGNLEFLARIIHREEPLDAEALADLRNLIDESQVGAANLREIVTDLKFLTKPEEAFTAEPVCLSKVLETVLRVAHHEIKHHVQVTANVDDLAPVSGRASLLSQVFLNLIMNAFQALPPYKISDNKILVFGENLTDSVAITVQDNGHGIPDDVVARVFEPFFTTRGDHGGTGLGLALCRKILQRMNGRIEFLSKVDEGTSVRITLPRA